MKPLEKSNILIVGLVRNCAKDIEINVNNIEASFCNAKSVKLYLLESDSTDSTCQILSRLSTTKVNFSFKSLGRLSDEIPKRTARIAFCRNYCVKQIKENPEYDDIDYVAIADMDGVNNKLRAEAVGSCWNRDDWDVCAANQLGPYYDIWALRHKLWSPNDCWQQAEFLRSYGASHFKSVVASVYSRMVCVSPSSEWIEVESAFGGLAIYRKEALVSVKYNGLTENGEEICEHVAAHAQIRSLGGRIFVNPALINAEFVEHSRYVLKFGLARFWISCQIRALALHLKLMPVIYKIRLIINKPVSKR
ncbi:hypothetical protein [Halomonas sp. Mc5H-6]|uniref:hypothetical protein n=1 Tax=Halomonas sp. Mc5H-6 TaxID=2954500 RepID=UPI0020970692|nr:hypothetical protein [Halomonas sp. Mc5H-6]MCO7246809.1 hypothetical protein [Halomonas sp. Mc5H-6]